MRCSLALVAALLLVTTLAPGCSLFSLGRYNEQRHRVRSGDAYGYRSQTASAYARTYAHAERTTCSRAAVVPVAGSARYAGPPVPARYMIGRTAPGPACADLTYDGPYVHAQEGTVVIGPPRPTLTAPAPEAASPSTERVVSLEPAE
jgi:hypothetical protein